MAKSPSPLLGYNNNVRHRGRVFHIQTEDSGVHRPHIITHLFMDGGRILKSVKTSYAEHVGSDGMSETVRGLMKEQHKAMFIALRDGQFDELVEGKKKPAEAAEKPEAPQAEPPSATSEESAPPTIDERRRADAPQTPLDADPPLPPEREALLRDELPPPPSTTEEDAPKTTREPERRRSARELTLDFDALARDLRASPSAERGAPPPAPREDGAGAPRAPAQRAPSDKSLGEVILSFLTEDLDPPQGE